jgi:hypothetical protein
MQAPQQGVDGETTYGAVSDDGGEPGWATPRSRQEVEERILLLSNDIGLILAQLAEDETSWCRRTGRTGLDYAMWRRRALFAKVHKERQLRECKQLRNHPLANEIPDGQQHDFAVSNLLQACARVLAAWNPEPGGGLTRPLDRALQELAAVVENVPPSYRLLYVTGATPADAGVSRSTAR